MEGFQEGGEGGWREVDVWFLIYKWYWIRDYILGIK